MVNAKTDKRIKKLRHKAMGEASVRKRDNSIAYDIRGVPMHSCTACGKKYQTKAQCIMHIKRVHEGK